MKSDHKMTQIVDLTGYHFRATIRNLLSEIKGNMFIMNQKIGYVTKKKQILQKNKPNGISRTKNRISEIFFKKIHWMGLTVEQR